MRRCMALMHPHMVLMSVVCVTARANAVLDVCVLSPHRCVSVAVMMSSAVRCVSIRVGMCPQCSHYDC